MFVGGLKGDVLDDLRNYFSQYGELIDSVVLKDPAGRPRGFGFVEFADPAVVDTVISEYSEHQINGSWVEVKRTTPKVAYSPAPIQVPVPSTRHSPPPPVWSPLPPARPSPSQGVCKVFIGGLSAESSEGDLLRYFQRYGRIVDLVVMQDKATGKPRGFGFVQYDDPRSVDDIMRAYDTHQINGKWVEVKRATPEDGKGKGKQGKLPGKGQSYDAKGKAKGYSMVAATHHVKGKFNKAQSYRAVPY